MLGLILYSWLVVVGLVDLLLVSPALRRAVETQTVGRLISTLFTLAGLVLAATGRLFVTAPLPPIVIAGLALIDLGLFGYALFLPDRGVLELIHRRDRQ